ncbi:hypothetical protein OF83DRAFT_1178892 [Amylostereum chailletii]|nr:hypothetical protein OF83DRAFT_1178892 [Amylostereum chailletii]
MADAPFLSALVSIEASNVDSVLQPKEDGDVNDDTANGDATQIQWMEEYKAMVADFPAAISRFKTLATLKEGRLEVMDTEGHELGCLVHAFSHLFSARSITHDQADAFWSSALDLSEAIYNLFLGQAFTMYQDIWPVLLARALSRIWSEGTLFIRSNPGNHTYTWLAMSLLSRAPNVCKMLWDRFHDVGLASPRVEPRRAIVTMLRCLAFLKKDSVHPTLPSVSLSWSHSCALSLSLKLWGLCAFDSAETRIAAVDAVNILAYSHTSREDIRAAVLDIIVGDIGIHAFIQRIDDDLKCDEIRDRALYDLLCLVTVADSYCRWILRHDPRSISTTILLALERQSRIGTEETHWDVWKMALLTLTQAIFGDTLRRQTSIQECVQGLKLDAPCLDLIWFAAQGVHLVSKTIVPDADECTMLVRTCVALARRIWLEGVDADYACLRSSIKRVWYIGLCALDEAKATILQDATSQAVVDIYTFLREAWIELSATVLLDFSSEYLISRRVRGCSILQQGVPASTKSLTFTSAFLAFAVALACSSARRAPTTSLFDISLRISASPPIGGYSPSLQHGRDGSDLQDIQSALVDQQVPPMFGSER